jgi:hypothetical protein
VQSSAASSTIITEYLLNFVLISARYITRTSRSFVLYDCNL